MSAPSPASSTARPRVALVGVDGYALIYLALVNAAHDKGLIDIAGAAVLERERRLPAVADLMRRGARIFGDYEEMLTSLKGGVDICMIPTGIQWHARMTIAALDAGANVLVEKPLAGSLADAEAIRAAEARNNRWVAVGFQDLYVREIEWLKEHLCAGAIGRIKRVHMIGLWPRPTSYFERNHWAGRLSAEGAAAMDSPINNALAHFVNLALYFAGPALEASADVAVTGAELLRAHRIESFDTAVIRARSPEGVEFWFGVSHACCSTKEPEILIEGETGRAEWRHERDCAITPDNGEELRRPSPSYAVNRQAMFDAVLARLSDPSVRICGTSIAIRHTALVDRTHRAAPIISVPPAQIEWCGDDADVPAIIGIEQTLARAHANFSSLAEAGLALPMETTAQGTAASPQKSEIGRGDS